MHLREEYVDIAKEMKLWPLVAAGMTARERDVAYLLLGGRNGPDMARELDINIRTVKQYLRRLYFKFDVDTSGPLMPHIVLAVKLYEYSR